MIKCISPYLPKLFNEFQYCTKKYPMLLYYNKFPINPISRIPLLVRNQNKKFLSKLYHCSKYINSPCCLISCRKVSGTDYLSKDMKVNLSYILFRRTKIPELILSLVDRRKTCRRESHTLPYFHISVH